jgi:hypothetical protein
VNKGKRIKIRFEKVDKGGVIVTTTKTAIVQYSSGDNITVKDEDGYICEIDRNIRSDDGAYIVLA